MRGECDLRGAVPVKRGAGYYAACFLFGFIGTLAVLCLIGAVACSFLLMR